MSKGLIGEGLWVPIKGAAHGRALTSRRPVFMTRSDVEQLGSDIARRFLAEGLRSTCILPLISRGRPLGTLAVASLYEEIFPQKDAELLQHVANQIAIAVDNALAFGQVVNRANRLTEEKVYLQDEIRTAHNFEEIISTPADASVRSGCEGRKSRNPLRPRLAHLAPPHDGDRADQYARGGIE